LNRWYAVFIFEIKPREEEPKSIISFDINENTVAVSRIDIIATIDKIADWNRRYATPQLYTIETNFGRLARRYGKIRNAIIERLKPHFTLPSGKYVNVANTREFRKHMKRRRPVGTQYLTTTAEPWCPWVRAPGLCVVALSILAMILGL
jgi:hypothetical protein